MLVFDLILAKSADAVPPKSCYAFKKQETIDAKVAEWEADGWRSVPSMCTVVGIFVPNPEDQAKDIELPLSDNSIVELVDSICNNTVVVADSFTEKTCLLASYLLARTAELSTSKGKEDVRVYEELKQRLWNLYTFKLRYIRNNFVHGNNHNPAKLLKWDALSDKVIRQRLGLSDDATQLTVLATLAHLCGGDLLNTGD